MPELSAKADMEKLVGKKNQIFHNSVIKHVYQHIIQAIKIGSKNTSWSSSTASSIPATSLNLTPVEPWKNIVPMFK